MGSMRSVPAVLLLILLISAGSVAASTRPELLVQTQAADVLGGALTDAVAHATAEIDAAKKQATTKPSVASAAVVRPTAPQHPQHPEHRITYRELFDRTVDRIKKQGNDAIDPALENM